MRAALLAFALAGCHDLLATEPDLPQPIGLTPSRAPAPASLYESFADTDRRAFSDFRPLLATHGRFIDDDALGTVWLPPVNRDFVPYATGGHWAHDGAAFVWIAEQPWGWITFHYGRWLYAQEHGWAWVPGRKYAGAWVDFRVADDGRHIGWAPTPPAWRWHASRPLAHARPGDEIDHEPVAVAAESAAPFVYCEVDDLFASPLASHLVAMPELLSVAAHTHPVAGAPALADLGLGDAPKPPSGDVDLQRAWMFARPSTSLASGARPRTLAGPRPRLRTFVAGAPAYVAR